MDSKERTAFDNRYDMKRQRKQPVGARHPKILQARKNKTWTPQLERYWELISPSDNYPLAGIPREPRASCAPIEPEPEPSVSNFIPDRELPYLSWLGPDQWLPDACSDRGLPYLSWLGPDQWLPDSCSDQEPSSGHQTDVKREQSPSGSPAPPDQDHHSERQTEPADGPCITVSLQIEVDLANF
jgi:hypothetical protein